MHAELDIWIWVCLQFCNILKQALAESHVRVLTGLVEMALWTLIAHSCVDRWVLVKDVSRDYSLTD